MKKILTITLAIALIIIIMPKNQQIKYPLDETSKQIIRQVAQEVVDDRVFEAVFSKYIYLSTIFEGDSGWGIIDSSANQSGATNIGMTLETGASSNDTTEVFKGVFGNNSFSFDERAKFRSSIYINGSGSFNDENIIYHLTVGSITGTVNPHYGFRAENGTLYGITSDGNNSSEKELMSIDDNQIYMVEAIFTPNTSVIFKVSDGAQFPQSKQLLKERAVMREDLPSGFMSFPINIFSAQLETTEDAAKQARIPFIEYIQNRPRY